MKKIYKTGWRNIIDKNGIKRKVNFKPSNFKKKYVAYDNHKKVWLTAEQINEALPSKIISNKYYRTQMTYNYVAKKGTRKGMTETIRIWIYTDKPLKNPSGELDSIKEKFEMDHDFLSWIPFVDKIEGRELNEEVDSYNGTLNEWTAVFEIGNNKKFEEKYDKED